MKVNVINQSKHSLPEYKTKGAAGMDVKANLEASVKIKPMERVLIPTGLYTEIPYGYEIQVRPRSGLTLKHGISVINSPGTIDSDYRGEIKIILINLSNETYTVEDGERIAQLVLAKHDWVEWEQAESLTESLRGEGGFGHTGK